MQYKRKKLSQHQHSVNILILGYANPVHPRYQFFSSLKSLGIQSSISLQMADFTLWKYCRSFMAVKSPPAVLVKQNCKY